MHERDIAQLHFFRPSTGANDRPDRESPTSNPAAGTAVGTDLSAIPVVVEPARRAPVKAAKRAAAVPFTPPPVIEVRYNDSSTPRAADAETPKTALDAAPPTPEIAGVAPTTITGCLEMRESDDRFRLTGTEGGNTPKARSWRTGFLKKRSAAVNLVGVSDARALEKEVGKRVAATGALTSSDLKVSSVRVVSPSCD